MEPRRLVAMLVVPVSLALRVSPGGEFGEPIGGLSPAQLQRFRDGRAVFKEIEGPADGLGPVFNGTSCAGCHNVGAIGGGSESVEKIGRAHV